MVDICCLEKVSHELNVFLVFQTFSIIGFGMTLFVVCMQKLSGLEGFETEHAFVLYPHSRKTFLRLDHRLVVKQCLICLQCMLLTLVLLS